jgi:hypothetical protein
MGTARLHRYHWGCWWILAGQQRELASRMTIGVMFLKSCLCIQTYTQTGVIIISLVYYYMSWIFLVLMVHCNFVNKWLTTPRPNVRDHLQVTIFLWGFFFKKNLNNFYSFYLIFLKTKYVAWRLLNVKDLSLKVLVILMIVVNTSFSNFDNFINFELFLSYYVVAIFIEFVSTISIFVQPQNFNRSHILNLGNLKIGLKDLDLILRIFYCFRNNPIFLGFLYRCRYRFTQCLCFDFLLSEREERLCVSGATVLQKYFGCSIHHLIIVVPFQVLH